ncbi:hypothetical protein G3I40_09430 [Streptomyces sp. SID14478]|uniref:hypothetical protein n=1 Tax=Streptomyces sp. SID14478 TaxID=2706073 RepID=UPI0013DA51DA|nr:hypothetical protein [Streptomyces sp. SID14478]NEB75444.1 hypothetical protein [Streptomyces sp. SID14478]
MSVASCHPSLQKDERYAQGRMLLDRIGAVDGEHAVVCGDLNEHPTCRRRHRPPDRG